MTSVLIADDHPLVVSGIKSLLSDTGYDVIATCSTGAEALDLIKTCRPEIVILDVAMPERTGLDVARTLRGHGDQRPIILLTASLNDRRLTDAIALGIQGIVLKEGAEHLLVRCLDEVSAGRKWIDRGLMQHALDLKSGAADGKSNLASLSPRERAISELVARGLRNREIATEIGTTEGTVKVHLHKIYEKLGVGNRTELAILCRNAEND